MANDAILVPIIKCQALCFWFCIICWFLLASLFQEIWTDTRGSKYKKAEMSFSTYLKNINAMALAVDNCCFLSNNLFLLNSMWVTHTRNPKKRTFSLHLKFLFCSQTGTGLPWKTDYVGCCPKIYYPSHKRTNFHIVVCLLVTVSQIFVVCAC